MDNYGDGETLANTNSHNGLRPQTDNSKAKNVFGFRSGNGEIDYKVLNPNNYQLDKESKRKLDVLDANTPNIDYVITDGQRNQKENIKVKGASKSRHLKKNGGDAIDVNPVTTKVTTKKDVEDIAKEASKAGFGGIITYTNQSGTSNNKNGGRLHLDGRTKKYHADKQVVLDSNGKPEIKANGNKKTRYVIKNYSEN
jgi:hypothetical protein